MSTSRHDSEFVGLGENGILVSCRLHKIHAEVGSNGESVGGRRDLEVEEITVNPVVEDHVAREDAAVLPSASAQQ